MAVYTQISEPELVRFLAGYDLGSLTGFEGILSGIENTNYKVETIRGHYILTLFEKRTDPADLPYFIAVKRHLAAKAFPCPEPVQARDGEILRRLAGRPAIMISFIEGAETPSINIAQCHELGKALARIHVALSDFTMTRPNRLDAADWPGLWRGREAEADALTNSLSEQIAADIEAITRGWPVADTLPTGTIHADLFPDNTFFTGDTFTGAIDFYFTCTGLLAYDLAICLNAWAFEEDNSYSLEKGTALVAGYQSVRPLEPAEITALPILARGAAMRFFLTRLIDWTSTPEGAQVERKDPLDYTARLSFHRTVQGPESYGARE